MNLLLLLLILDISYSLNINYYRNHNVLVGFNISAENFDDINIEFILGSRLVYRIDTERNYTNIITDKFDRTTTPGCLFSTVYVIDGPNMFYRLCYINETKNFGRTITIGTLSYSFVLNTFDPTLLYYAFILQKPIIQDNFNLFLFRDGRYDFDRITLQYPQILVSGDTTGVLYVAYNCGYSKCSGEIQCNKKVFQNEICENTTTDTNTNTNSSIGFLELFIIMILVYIILLAITNSIIIYSIRRYLFKQIRNMYYNEERNTTI
jgi:hypothetical protein